ncbi:MAG: carboxymuconolactone decarboxylase family protein [Nitrospinota bacterium]
MAAVADWRSREDFSPKERLALEYAERMTFTDQDVTDAFFGRLREAFSEPALVQLTACVSMENFRSKFNNSFRIESNGLCPLPAPE